MTIKIPRITSVPSSFTNLTSNKKKIPRIPGPVLIIFSAFLWSLDGLLRGSLREIPPAMLVTLEHLLGLIILFPFIWTFIKEFKNASWTARISLIITSVISGALGTLFYTYAIQQVFALGAAFTTVVLVQQLQPVIAILLSKFILNEKLNPRILLAGAFAILGVYLVNVPTLIPNINNPDTQTGLFIAGLAFAAAVSWGAGTVFSKSALTEFDFKSATTGRFIFTIFASLVLALILPNQIIPISDITMEQWIQLIIIVFSAGAVALLFYYKGLQKTKAHVSTLLELTWPASALLIDIFRGVDFTPSQILGVVIVVMMIYRISKISIEEL